MLDGDEWVINGQKIWTTQGFVADYGFVLCRTDTDAPKHKGISYLLVPMNQDGVEVRPIKQIDGSAEFAEVFFTDARCPKDNVVGGLNNGWKVAMTTLGFERGTSATTGYRRFETELEHIIEAAKANGTIDDPLIRQRLAQAWSKVQIMRINGLRSLAVGRSPGKQGPRRRRPRRHQQDVLERVPPGGHEAGHGHPRHGGPDPHSATPARRSRCPATARRQTNDRVPGQRPAVVVLLQPVRDDLGRHRRRSSATSSASACSASPRSPRPPAERRDGPSRPRVTGTPRRRTTLTEPCPMYPPRRRGAPRRPVRGGPSSATPSLLPASRWALKGLGIVVVMAIVAVVAVVGYGWYRYNQIGREDLALAESVGAASRTS